VLRDVRREHDRLVGEQRELAADAGVEVASPGPCRLSGLEVRGELADELRLALEPLITTACGAPAALEALGDGLEVLEQQFGLDDRDVRKYGCL